MIDADIRVEDARWAAGRDLDALVSDCLAAASGELAEPPDDVEITVLFTDDDAQEVLNREYRGKASSTNVLSFPSGGMPVPAGVPRPLGDVSLAYGTIVREAQEAGIALDAHVSHLIIHGFLHLLGYDHDNDADASVMETTETRALARLGIADPYRPEQV